METLSALLIEYNVSTPMMVIPGEVITNLKTENQVKSQIIYPFT
jgi:hypothetical protein